MSKNNQINMTQRIIQHCGCNFSKMMAGDEVEINKIKEHFENETNRVREEVINNMSVLEMEELIGIDKIEGIKLTPSDTKRVEEDGEYFRGWYEEELRDKVRELYTEENNNTYEIGKDFDTMIERVNTTHELKEEFVQFDKTVNKKLWEFLERAKNFPEDQKKNPLYLINHKNEQPEKSDAYIFNPNSPSHLETWYEDESEKLKIIEEHGFELLLLIESKNVTLKDAADELIEWYTNAGERL